MATNRSVGGLRSDCLKSKHRRAVKFQLGQAQSDQRLPVKTTHLTMTASFTLVNIEARWREKDPSRGGRDRAGKASEAEEDGANANLARFMTFTDSLVIGRSGKEAGSEVHVLLSSRTRDGTERGRRRSLPLA